MFLKRHKRIYDLRYESSEEVENEDIVLLVHCDLEGGSYIELGNTHNQSDIAIPHTPGVAIPKVHFCLLKQLCEVECVLDGFVGKGGQLKIILRVVSNGE